jgi:Arc/MetJ-type ribon-helix-helix transcriptional regulator
MKRTTVTLTDELAVAVDREARRRRLSVSEILREALGAHLGLAGAEPRHLPFAALGASGTRTTARELEEILADEWSRARDC